MPTVTFHATPEFKTWVHSKGGKRVGTYGEETTLKIVGPVVLADGESVEMDDFDAAWCTVNYPMNFTSEASKPEPLVRKLNPTKAPIRP